MSKTETPSSVNLYVQWVLYPFGKPQVAAQKSANSKWALVQTKDLLRASSIDSDEIKISQQFNGMVLLEIFNPEKEVKGGKNFWEAVLELLKESNEIVSVYIDVINEISDKIATNLADHVPLPWHQGYKGRNATTLIYHQ